MAVGFHEIDWLAQRVRSKTKKAGKADPRGFGHTGQRHGPVGAKALGTRLNGKVPLGFLLGSGSSMRDAGRE